MERHLDLVCAGWDRSLCSICTPDERSRPLPLIVYIHGGAWRAGDKAHPRALRYVSEGFAVASVGYRLSQEAIFPAQIHDCKAACDGCVPMRNVWIRCPSPGSLGQPPAHLAALLACRLACGTRRALGNPDQSAR